MKNKTEIENLLEDKNVWWVFSDICDRLYMNGFRYTLSRFQIMLNNVIEVTAKCGNQPLQLRDLKIARDAIK